MKQNQSTCETKLVNLWNEISQLCETKSVNLWNKISQLV